MNLRPYQLDAVEAIRVRLRAKAKRILVVSPVGSGKTVCFAHILASAAARGHRSLVVAHRVELIAQARDKILAAGVPADQVGIIAAGLGGANPGARIQVASIDTLRNRAKPHADILVVDEAHRTGAKSYGALLEAYPDAVVLGWTASPWRLDGQGLGRWYQDLVVVASVRELIDAGHLVRPRVFTHPVGPDLTGVHTVGGDYNQGELAAAVDKRPILGSIVEHWLKHAAGVPTIAFAVTVEHSRHITATFVEAGVRAEHVDGETPPAERKAIFERLASGQTQVVSNVGIAVEGLDIPIVKCVILARPTQSKTVYIQSVGRCMRPVPGRPDITSALVLDHAGLCLAHGLPHQDREYSLEDRPTRAGKPATMSVATCPQCFAVFASGCALCPECGHEMRQSRQLQTEDGTLVEIQEQSQDNYGPTATGVRMLADAMGGASQLAAAIDAGAGQVFTWINGRRAVPKQYVSTLNQLHIAHLGADMPTGPSEHAVLSRRIQKASLANDHARGLKLGTTNGELRRRFGKPRSDMSIQELAETYRYLGELTQRQTPERDSTPAEWSL